MEFIAGIIILLAAMAIIISVMVRSAWMCRHFIGTLRSRGNTGTGV